MGARGPGNDALMDWRKKKRDGEMDKPFLKTYPASLLIKITKIVLTYYFGYCYHLFSTYHMPLVWPVARELTQETTEIFLPPVQLMGFSVAGSPPAPTPCHSHWPFASWRPKIQLENGIQKLKTAVRAPSGSEHGSSALCLDQVVGM